MFTCSLPLLPRIDSVSLGYPDGMPYERDGSYYCQDLVLLVENTLFRVPRFIFQHSEVFQDMLSVPQGDGGSLEGSDDDHPLFLPSYLAQDFRQLLKVLLPQQYPSSKPELSAEEWMSVLKLATTWNFDAVRETAVNELATYGESDPILRIIIAKRFNIAHWFVPSIESLARREDPVSDDDCQRLMELGNPVAVCKFVAKICRVRERFQPATSVTAMPPGFCVGSTCRTHGSTYGLYCALVINATHTAKISNQASRDVHEFTEAIKDVFDCEYEEPEPNVDGPMVLLPKPLSWDFS